MTAQPAAQRRRIALDARKINTSTGTYIVHLLKHLQIIDPVNRYTILVRQQDRTFWVPSANNFTVEVAEFDPFSLAEQTEFRRFLEARNFDLVHFCMQEQPILYRGRRVSTFHDLTLLRTYDSSKNWLIFRAKQMVAKAVFRAAIRRCEIVITPSEYSRTDVAQFAGVSPDKIVVTYEAAEASAIGVLEPYPVSGSQFLLCVGNFFDYKNLRRLGEAHQILLATHPNLELVLAGRPDGSSKRLQDEFSTLGYRNITFTGYVTDPQRDWLYANCAAYVFPSLSEGFGLPGLEAMLGEAPLVSSSATCLPEVYGDAANYFDPRSASDMARAIGEVIDSPERAQQIRENGRRRLAGYSWRRMAEETLSVYETALIQKAA